MYILCIFHAVDSNNATASPSGEFKNIAVVAVSHGSAYSVARATQQVNGRWQLWGVRTPYTLKRLIKSLGQMSMLMINKLVILA